MNWVDKYEEMIATMNVHDALRILVPSKTWNSFCWEYAHMYAEYLADHRFINAMWKGEILKDPELHQMEARLLGQIMAAIIMLVASFRANAGLDEDLEKGVGK